MSEKSLASLSLKAAREITGGLSKTSAMPGASFGIPAAECPTGRKLAEIPGTQCERCYAKKNMYAMANVQAAQYGRLATIYDPQWIDAMIVEIRKATQTVKFFRWFDSGDLQSLQMLQNIVAIAIYLPDVRFWMPTHEYGIVRHYLALGGQIPSNLVIRISSVHIDDVTAPRIADLPISTVRSAEEKLATDAFACRKHYQDGKCLDCRACWDSTIEHVSYYLH